MLEQYLKESDNMNERIYQEEMANLNQFVEIYKNKMETLIGQQYD